MNEKTTKINSTNAEFIPSLPHAEGRTRRDRSPDLAVPSKTIAKICMALLRYSLPMAVPFFLSLRKRRRMLVASNKPQKTQINQRPRHVRLHGERKGADRQVRLTLTRQLTHTRAFTYAHLLCVPKAGAPPN